MTPILLGRRAGRFSLAALSTLALAAGTAALPAQASPTHGPVATNPYAPSYGHPYRGGAVPTRAVYAKMRQYQAAHPNAVPGVSNNAAATAANNLFYHGSLDGIGVINGKPRVYLVFWGSQWGSSGTDGRGNTTLSGDPKGLAPRLQQLFKGLGVNNEQWSGVMTQYCEGIAINVGTCPGNAPHVGYPDGGAYAGMWVDTSSAAPSNASAHQIAVEAVTAASTLGNTTPASNRNAQYFIVSPPGTHPDGFNLPGSGFCGWHNWNNDSTLDGGGAAPSSVGDVAFTNMPYVTDGGCGANFVNPGGAGVLDGVTIVAGHEYAETITDPTLEGWWDSSFAENADKCAWLSTGPGAMANVAFSTGAFPMQGTWSNDDNSCEMSHSIVRDIVGGGRLSPNEPPAGFTWCAGEGQSCAFSGTRVVAFGAGSYRYQDVTGGIACTNAAFGGDPAVGVLKGCYVAPTGGPSGYTKCASEGGACSFSGPAMIAYGVNGEFTFYLLGTALPCTNDAFGGDPAPKQVKGCYLAPAGGPAGHWTSCGADGATCTVNGTQTVAFGARGAFNYATVSGSFSCTVATFGGDPIYGAGKACYTRSGPPVGFSTQCASEQSTCNFSGFRTVAYGADGSYRYKSFTGGTPCTNAAFGTDPIVSVVKSCYLTP
jgi:serine protease